MLTTEEVVNVARSLSERYGVEDVSDVSDALDSWCESSRVDMGVVALIVGAGTKRIGEALDLNPQQQEDLPAIVEINAALIETMMLAFESARGMVDDESLEALDFDFEPEDVDDA
jgi:hypothetical protein